MVPSSPPELCIPRMSRSPDGSSGGEAQADGNCICYRNVMFVQGPPVSKIDLLGFPTALVYIGILTRATVFSGLSVALSGYPEKSCFICLLLGLEPLRHLVAALLCLKIWDFVLILNIIINHKINLDYFIPSNLSFSSFICVCNS